MPVYKYKTFQEAQAHLSELQQDLSPIERLAILQNLRYAIKPQRPCQRGVFKFRTFEEAEKHRNQ